MDKKQAQKKLEKKKVVWKVWSRNKPFKKGIEKTTINNIPTWTRLSTKKEIMTTTFAPDVKVQIKSATQEPKRKDSRQVKVERLEAEVNLLATERSSLHSIIWGLKAENNDLKNENNGLRNENQELRENVSKDVKEMRDALIGEVVECIHYRADVIRLKRWVFILAGILFAYSVLNIVLGFYGI